MNFLKYAPHIVLATIGVIRVFLPSMETLYINCELSSVNRRKMGQTCVASVLHSCTKIFDRYSNSKGFRRKY